MVDRESLKRQIVSRLAEAPMALFTTDFDDLSDDLLSLVNALQELKDLGLIAIRKTSYSSMESHVPADLVTGIHITLEGREWLKGARC